MPVKLTKVRQQEVIADFIYEKNLELCMYVYLDAFLDIHRKKFPQKGNTYGINGIRALLEASYEGIRDDMRQNGLLTVEASSRYMMTLDRS